MELSPDAPLSPAQLEWISSLMRLLRDDIPLGITLEDFKSFFKHKKEGTASLSISACPLFFVNSDVSLSTYKKLCYGASFLHPISGMPIDTHAVQYVDDTSQFLYCVTMSEANLDTADTKEMLLQRANHNAQLWSEIYYGYRGGEGAPPIWEVFFLCF